MLLQRIPKRAKRTGRWKSQAHCGHVRKHACVNCGSMVNVEVAHKRDGTDAGMGRKSSDYYSTPLCGGLDGCHALQHRIGEPAFWEAYAKDKGHTVWDVIAELIRTSPRRREIEEHKEGGCSLRSGPPATDG
jgi:hypothetical protein